MSKYSDIVRKNIKSFRVSAGLSQESLAEKADLHRAYIGQIERGEKNIGIPNLEKISIALNVKITKFFEG